MCFVPSSQTLRKDCLRCHRPATHSELVFEPISSPDAPLSSSRTEEEGPAESKGDCRFLSSSDSGVSGVGVKDPSAVGGLLSFAACAPAPIASRSLA